MHKFQLLQLNDTSSSKTIHISAATVYVLSNDKICTLLLACQFTSHSIKNKYQTSSGTSTSPFSKAVMIGRSPHICYLVHKQKAQYVIVLSTGSLAVNKQSRQSSLTFIALPLSLGFSWGLGNVKICFLPPNKTSLI